ncbi:methyltransferase domain-containing protein [Candidatus Woesearchaeota archaeon]|nr:methyltransferase domain-containing protein [Candidatus Woesearchaeota archaeon]
MNCRICGNSELKKILSLGSSPLANNLSKKEEAGREEKYPLELLFCGKCKLVQLGHIMEPDVLFRNYLYVTSTTKTFQQHFTQMAEDVCKRYGLGKGSLAVDIGSNDGLLLKGFAKIGLSVTGVEPAVNLAKLANESGVETINDYFNQRAVNEILRTKGKAAVITATNVFAHVNDIKTLTQDVKTLMKDDGTFIIEAPYLPDMLEKMTFDAIYHEHLSYFSLMPLDTFFSSMGMKITDVQHVDSHGGSLRVFVQKQGRQEDSVSRMLEGEKAKGIDSEDTYRQFAEKAYANREKLVQLVKSLREQGCKVAGYGAPAKATTLLNFCGLGKEEIEYVVDDNPMKVGLYIPGTGIPIVKSERLETEKPDYLIILAWNFANEIIGKTGHLAEKGVRLIIPVPTPRIALGGNEKITMIKPAFADARGEITNVIEQPVSHIAVIKSAKGSIRGNHYHPEQEQYVYLITGSYESISKEMKTGRVEKVNVEAGDLVHTPPMIAHAMKFLEDSIMLNITTGNRDANKFGEHTKKYQVTL